MKISVEIDSNTTDEVIERDLKWHIEDMERNGYDPHETPDNKANLYSSLCRVLKHYMTHHEYKEYMKGKLK